MRYPQLKVQAATRKTVDVFRGYNHNLRIGEGEFNEALNDPEVIKAYIGE